VRPAYRHCRFQCAGCAVVLIHHEVLVRLSSVLGNMASHQHFRLAVARYRGSCRSCSGSMDLSHGVLCMHHYLGWGLLFCNFNGRFLGLRVTFRSATFTTVGYGDIEPIGNLRFLDGH